MSEIERLLRENETECQALKDRLKDVLKPEHDDLWILRFILSNKTAAEADEPARFTIQWTHEHQREIELVKSGQKLPFAAVIDQFQVVGEHKYTARGDPLFYVRIGLCNTKGLMDAVPFDDVLLYFTCARLQIMQYCDAESKKQGRLVKAMSILDFQDAKWQIDNRFNKLIGESSKLNEKLFPQLVGLSFFVNVPSFMVWGFNLIKPLMSKRAVEKMRFCPGKTSGHPISDCPYVSANIRLEDIPTFLGGKCNCPGGCIGGIPNSQTRPISGLTDDGFIKLSIPARSDQILEFPVLQGIVMQYTFKSESKKMRFEAWFETEHQTLLKQAIFDHQKLDVDGEGVSGKFEAAQNGMVKIRFDNTKSLLLSANMSYKVDFTGLPVPAADATKTTSL